MTISVSRQPAQLLNAEGKPYRAQKQRALLAKWLPHLEAIPEIDLIWIEGSMTIPERENPGSDIDIRFGIKDDAYEELWNTNRIQFFQPLGEVLPLAPFRIVSQEGILIEFEAYPTSDCHGKPVFMPEFLLNRLPEGQPGFAGLTRIANEYWPHKHAVNLENVGSFTIDVLRRMPTAATPFFSEKPHSASFELHLLRTKLMQMLYWRAGIQPFMRAKHLEQIFPDAYFDDYAQGEFLAEENAMDMTAIGAATLRNYALLLEHCEALFSEIQRQQDYPAQWASRIYNKLSKEIGEALDARQPN